MILSEQEKGLLFALQKGLPLESRPLAAVGRQFGFSEREVASFIERQIAEGSARRLGGIFDIRRLGYRSVLCAASVRERSLMDDTAAILALNRGITHCYERGWPASLDPKFPGGQSEEGLPNLWFTFACRCETFDEELASLKKLISPVDVICLPATTRFKIDVVFDPLLLERDAEDPGMGRCLSGHACSQVQNICINDVERSVVRLFQGHLPPVPGLYLWAATKLNINPAKLLAMLRRWRREGLLRRVGLVVRHRKLGFEGNGMAVWPVPKGRVHEVGRRLAASINVTHCYERPRVPEFPFNLYAMMHAANHAEALRLFQKISDSIGIEGGRLLCSLREFKKASINCFS